MKLFIVAFTLLPILTYAAPIGTNTRQQLVKKSESVNLHARAVQQYARQADANAQRPEDDADGEEESPAAQQASATATATASGTATAKATDTGVMKGTATVGAGVKSTGVVAGKGGMGGKGSKGGKGGKIRQQEAAGAAKKTTKVCDVRLLFTLIIFTKRCNVTDHNSCPVSFLPFFSSSNALIQTAGANAPFTTVICQPCPPGAICKMDCIPYTVSQSL